MQENKKIRTITEFSLKYQLHFWIPYIMLSILLLSYLYLSSFTILSWVSLFIIIIVTFFIRAKILRSRLLYRIPIWLLFIAISITVITLTKPSIKNKSAVAFDNPKYTDTVQTEYGLVSGVYNKDKSVKIYAGIPYASPPVGELRWKAPQIPQKWEGVLKADHFSNCAEQRKIPTIVSKLLSLSMGTDIMKNSSINDTEQTSEDCLYLNIWTGSKTNKNDKRPVIVYIHGGSFTSGSGSIDIYNGESMAKKGAVFVTINYRLGIFGFLADPKLSAESDYGTSGNYGLLDQIAALKWVQKNIANFGGDPNNVTIAGESAGSMSVNILQASPLAKGLFKRVIGESGANFGSRGIKGAPMQDLSSAEQTGLELTKDLKVSSLNELREEPASDLLKASKRLSTRPIIDGYVLPDSIYSIYASGKENDVPTLIGYNANESSIFISLPWPLSWIPSYSSLNAVDYKAAINKTYGSKADDFLDIYSASDNAKALQSQLSSGTMQWFGWHMFTWARLLSQSSTSNIYFYHFSRIQPGSNTMKQLGASHGSEIAYAYGNLDKNKLEYTDYDYKLSDTMLSYWYNFAATGNPNGNGLPTWDAFDIEHEKNTMEFGDQVEMRSTPNQDKINFFDEYEASIR